MPRVSHFMSVLILCLSGSLFAQVEEGTIVGSVLDPSESAIPAASVEIANTATGAKWEIKTNAQGEFASPPLRPGTYSITVQASGFGRTIQTVILDVSQHARVNFHLQLGSTAQEVSVSGGEPLLDTQSAALGNVRTTKEVNDLPLNGRNAITLFFLAAGVQTAIGSTSNAHSPVNQYGITGGSVNGADPGNNDIRYDGIQSQDTDQNVVAYIPNADAVEQFKVQTSASDASFGRNGGGTLNLVYKSGTNQFHGTLFEFLRNSAFDAKNFFDSPVGGTPPFKQNQFGGVLGGPIRRDRTFFFLAYQSTIIRQAQTYVSAVPTAAETGGNFSGLSALIYDPATTVVNPASPTGLSRSPFPGNIIPATRFNPAGEKLVNLYPLPNLPGLANNYLYNPIRRSLQNLYDLRIDHTIDQNDTFFGRYSMSVLPSVNPSYLPAPAVGAGPSYPGNTNTLAAQAVLGYTHLFSATTVYEFRAGFTRFRAQNEGFLVGTNEANLVGIPGIDRTGYESGLGPSTITGFTGLGDSTFSPMTRANNNFQYSNQVNHTVGKHSLKFGYDLLRRQLNTFTPTNPGGAWTFAGQFTQNLASAAGTGSGLADLELGLNSSASLSIEAMYGNRRWEQSWYAADDIRLTKYLTLNIGVRYEITTPWTEVYDRMGGLVPALGFVYQVNTPQLPGHTVTLTNYRDISPRFGFAYSPNSKTTIRSGYGEFYSFEGVATANLPSKSPPTAGQLSITNNTSTTDLSTVSLLSSGFPLQLPSIFDPTGESFKYSPRHDPDSMIQQLNFSIQRDIGFGTTVTTAYVRTVGEHLYIFPNINQPVPGPGAAAARRPYPTLGDGGGRQDAASSTYNSLQVTAEKRYANGLTLLTAYTYSHSIDDAASPQNSQDLSADRGNSSFDVRHHLVISWLYNLPFGKDGRFLNHISGVSNALGGWQLNGIITLMTGQYFSPSSGVNTLGSGAGTQRPNRIADGNLPASERTVNDWFNLKAFTTPAPYMFGNAGRDILVGPGTKQADISLFKRFKLGTNEKRWLQFRAEVFNLLNTPQFNNPNATIGVSTAGTITSAGDPYSYQRTSRQIQLALKLYY